MSTTMLPHTASPLQPMPVKRARTPRKARTVYPMRVYATEDPRAYHCTSESNPDARYLVECDLECCSCPQWVARLMACPIGHPERLCKHLIHVRDTRIGDVLQLETTPRDQAPIYEPDPFADAADESCHPDAGLTVVDGYVIGGGSPLCAACGKRRVGEVGSECYVCVAAELCL